MQRKPVPKAKSATAQATTLPAKKISWKSLQLLAAILGFLLYANTLNHKYTVDDGTVIENNKLTKQGVSAIPDIFSSAYRAGYWDRNEGLYRPLSVAMFAIEYQLAPGQPWLGHVINVILFSLSCAILLALLRRLFRKYHPLIPLLCALLFITHPVHTEVVANIKSRDEILSLLLGLSALWSLFRYIDTNRMHFMILSCSLYAVGLFAKESSVTYAAVVPLALWCSADINLKRTLILSIPYAALALLFVIIRHTVLGEGTEYELMLINNSIIGATNAADRFATAMNILGRYILLLFFPVKLVFDYSYNTIPVYSLSDVSVLASIILFGVLTFIAVRQLKDGSLLSLGILLFLGTISIVANIFFLIEATMAERFLYTPSLGFCIALAGALGKSKSFRGTFNGDALTSLHFRNNRILLAGCVLVLALYAGRTIARNADWKDNITLLGKDVTTAPNSARIRFAYGSGLLIEQAIPETNNQKKQEYLDQAIMHLQRGVQILPNYNDAWYHLGIAYKEKGDAKNAVYAFEQARSYKAFEDASRLTNSGVAYGLAGIYDKAIADLQKAVDADPSSPDGWNNLGLYLQEAGKIEESKAALNKAINLRENFDKAYYNLGNTFAKSGAYAEGMMYYRKAIAINPSYTDAYNNMGICHATIGNADSAIFWFEKAVIADPENVKAVSNLGMTLQNRGDTTRAKQYLEKARSLGAGL